MEKLCSLEFHFKEVKTGSKRWGFRERSAADYRRVFELDPAIDTGKIAAKMEQGMLLLTLPKSERIKPRKITVSD